MKNSLVRASARISTLTCAALFAGNAIAQGAAPAIADCHRIESSVERLACYDAASGRAGVKSAQPATAVATPATPVAPNVTTDAMSQAIAKEAASNAAPSMIDASWDFDPASPRYDIRFYRENYLLIGRYTDKVNTAPYEPLFAAAGEPVHLDSTEAKFQISFKTRLWTTDDRRWGAWVGYTQQNQWQVYNDDISRPFRETNYMPEAFISYRPGIELPGGFQWRLVNAGYNHQSNGRTDTLSRSWDRLFVELGAEKENLALFAKFWYRLPESDDKDDNPDITDYYGHGELSALYRWRGNSFTASVRGNVNTGKGAVQLGWMSPPLLGAFRGYVQFFSGYGESLIDYNWKQTTIGAGIALSDGL
jgi:phospholipase A1/A2